MPGNHSRRKGSGAELELARLIHEELGIRMQRQLDQPRSGGWDLELHPEEDGLVAEQIGRYAIECKRAATASPATVAGWWRQAWTQAAAAYRIPCLAYRVDRQGWLFVVPLQQLDRTLPAATGDSLDFCAVLTLRGWAALVREGGPASKATTYSGFAPREAALSG